MFRPNYNQTKIVATLGPATNDRGILRDLINEGVDVFRLNASHGTQEEHQQMIDLIRQINQEEGLNIGILLDLQGPKIRIGKLEEAVAIAAGDRVVLNCDLDNLQEGDIPIRYDTFAKDVKQGDLVLVEDGKVQLEVLETDQECRVTLQVRFGDSIGSRKGVNLPYTKITLPSLTDKDRKDLVLAIRNDIEWIALSFVRRANDVDLLRRILRESDCKSRIVAKIEKPEAIEDIDAIIDGSDGIMVARGDLGVEIPIEDVPFEQKKIIKKCNTQSKPVIVATQMLDSMIEKPRPTRAEATDVANAVLDGADALMLSGETSIGRYPVETIRVMSNIINKAEKDDSVFNRFQEAEQSSPTYTSDAVMLTAVRLAKEVDAQALVGMTSTGYTAYQLSKHRPRANIFIFTDNRELIPAMNLVWGVRALYYDRYVGTDETIRDVIRELKERRLLQPGDRVINTASMPIHARKRTNMVKFTLVE